MLVLQCLAEVQANTMEVVVEPCLWVTLHSQQQVDVVVTRQARTQPDSQTIRHRAALRTIEAPATFSSISIGTEKAVRGMSGWIWSFGITKAPTDTLGAPNGSLDLDSANTTL